MKTKKPSLKKIEKLLGCYVVEIIKNKGKKSVYLDYKQTQLALKNGFTLTEIQNIINYLSNTELGLRRVEDKLAYEKEYPVASKNEREINRLKIVSPCCNSGVISSSTEEWNCTACGKLLDDNKLIKKFNKNFTK